MRQGWLLSQDWVLARTALFFFSTIRYLILKLWLYAVSENYLDMPILWTEGSASLWRADGCNCDPRLPWRGKAGALGSALGRICSGVPCWDCEQLLSVCPTHSAHSINDKRLCQTYKMESLKMEVPCLFWRPFQVPGDRGDEKIEPSSHEASSLVGKIGL